MSDNDSDNDNNLSPLPLMPGIKNKPRRSNTAFWILALILLVVAAAGLAFQNYKQYLHLSPSNDMGQIEQRLSTLESQVQSLNGRVVALSKEPAAIPEEMKNIASKQSASDIARMQSDMVALSSALNALQNEVKESSDHAQHTQQLTQTVLAAAIASIQLRATATTDQSFVGELAALRDVSPNDAGFQQALNDLQPIAASGAPTAPELHDELLTLEAGADQATSRAQAQNVWKKMLVELKGLVSIRRLHRGSDTYQQIESDLAKNDLPAALDQIKTLSPEAQNVLSDLRGKIEARLTINAALHELSDHFSAWVQTRPALAP